MVDYEINIQKSIALLCNRGYNLKKEKDYSLQHQNSQNNLKQCQKYEENEKCYSGDIEYLKMLNQLVNFLINVIQRKIPVNFF